MGKEILLNRMYAGGFPKTEGNIGHEVINLFKDDKGRNFIYVLSDGYMANSHNNKIKTILLVRWGGNNIMEILAKAEDLEQLIICKKNGEEERKDLHDKQIEYIKENEVTYGGVRLDLLYENNIYKGALDDKALYLTFKTKKMRKPIKPIYITDKPLNHPKEDTFVLENINFGKQSMKLYYEEGTSAYNTLLNIIDNDQFWENENSTESIQAELYTKDENHNFLKIIKKEDDELVFSNMLQYYFMKNSESFASFCEEILDGIKIDNHYTITREKNDNIDLLVEDTQNIIVIENKIKSRINGIKHDIYNEKVQTQLSKYYKWANDNANGRKVSCFIFSPNYNKIDITNYEAGEYYTIIEYSKIYEFFLKHKDEYKEDKYFEEFLKSLYKHAQVIDNDLFEDMRRRFSIEIMDKKNENINI